MVGDILRILFGGGGNALRETAEVFRVNADAADSRAADMQRAALDQMAAEFRVTDRGFFDRLIDGLNRVPRPAMALGTLGLMVSAMVDPLWFGERMAGLALVPEPLWWLLGAIVSFYFGARHQAKGQEFQRSLAVTLARAPTVVETVAAMRALRPTSPGAADPGADARAVLAATTPEANRALADWRGQGATM
ncbi:MAG: holin family protein [Roseovarius sp.]|nr:holin family protein [Roseovarius sp.]